ncbi:MAG: sugar ABC transporter permease [Clostridia bacterium]|nr:sugar ABC transporter permease [Clostridia bacterium]
MSSIPVRRKQSWLTYLNKNKYLYLMCLPGLAFLIIFKYIPMYGILMAFQDFNFKKGIFGSPFNDFKNFKQLFDSAKFYTVFANSIVLSVMRLVVTFPIPIILALLINEIRNKAYKRTTQTLMYLPHFISWVVLGGIATNFLSVGDGLINAIIVKLGGEKINFLGSSEWFRFVIIVTNIWKEAGWGTIIYLSALAAINPEYYEAATVDGANRWQKIAHITLPGIANTIVITLVLQVGGLMNNGFEQIYLFQNDLNVSVSEVFETYTYRIGIVGGRYSYSTAVGLFKNVIGTILIFSTNTIAKKLGGATLY